MAGIGVHDERNRCSASVGIAVHHGPESAFIMGRNAHTGAGLAILDFPLMFGAIVPDNWNAGIANHFAHRPGAIVVAAIAIATSVFVWRHHRNQVNLARVSLLIVAFIVFQVTLGALTVLGRRQPWINSLHVVGGAVVLTTSLVITLWSWRCRIADRGLRIANWAPDDETSGL